MQIFTIDLSLVQRGREAFSAGIRQSLRGRYEPTGYAAGERPGGLDVVPGAIVAAIEAGFDREEDIVPMVARVSRCRETTVGTVLDGLSANAIPDGVWARDAKGQYIVMKHHVGNAVTVIAT